MMLVAVTYGLNLSCNTHDNVYTVGVKSMPSFIRVFLSWSLPHLPRNSGNSCENKTLVSQQIILYSFENKPTSATKKLIIWWIMICPFCIQCKSLCKLPLLRKITDFYTKEKLYRNSNVSPCCSRGADEPIMISDTTASAFIGSPKSRKFLKIQVKQIAVTELRILISMMKLHMYHEYICQTMNQ